MKGGTDRATDGATDRWTYSTWRRAIQEAHADVGVHMAEPGCGVTGSEEEHTHAWLQLCLMGQVMHHIDLAPAITRKGLATTAKNWLLQGCMLQALAN